MEISEELAALFSRADRAEQAAKRLIRENDLWRQSVARQFEVMYELGSEFRKPGRINYP